MPLLEVCVDSLESLDAAQAGGADRIELCARLDQGGLSPWPELLKAARARARLPMHVMVRSRAGDYVYTWDELEDMAQQVEELKTLKVNGVVFGALTADGDVAREMTEEIVRLAAPLPVTFHRAFDTVRDPRASLEALVALGVKRVLTTGGRANAYAGREALRELVTLARGRIVVMAGGGVRSHNVRAILEQSGVTEVHSSTWFRLSDVYP